MSEVFKSKCPGCAHELEIPLSEAHEGGSVVCTHCGERIAIHGDDPLKIANDAVDQIRQIWAEAQKKLDRSK